MNFTDEELLIIYNLLENFPLDDSNEKLNKIGRDIERKIEAHFGWNWNG